MGLMQKIQEIKQLCNKKEESIYIGAGIGQSEFTALCVIDLHEAIRLKVLVEKLDLSMSRGVRLIDSLCKKGLFERKVSENDARVVLISLTKKGHLLRKKFDSTMKECESSLGNVLGTNRAAVESNLNLVCSAMKNNIASSK